MRVLLVAPALATAAANAQRKADGYRPDEQPET